MNNIDKFFLDGLRDGSVYSVFQPIIDKKMHVVGFEILIRWSVNSEILSPEYFLPLIRKGNTWQSLADYLIKLSVRKINEYGGRYFFSFNVSGEEITSSKFVDAILESIKSLQSVHWVSKIVIEISEKIVVSENSPIIYNIRRLRDIGCTIYFDDVLSHSSTIYPMQVIKFDGVKIDKHIIRRMNEGKVNISFIKAIIYLCSLIDLSCIAEGIENENQLNILLALGVSYFQGYLISMPVQDGALNEFLESYNS